VQRYILAEESIRRDLISYQLWNRFIVTQSLCRTEKPAVSVAARVFIIVINSHFYCAHLKKNAHTLRFPTIRAQGNPKIKTNVKITNIESEIKWWLAKIALQFTVKLTLEQLGLVSWLMEVCSMPMQTCWHVCRCLTENCNKSCSWNGGESDHPRWRLSAADPIGWAACAKNVGRTAPRWPR